MTIDSPEMAKKKKDKTAGRGDAVRTAVEQAFQTSAEQAGTARGRAQDIVDEFAQAAGRVREVLEDLRPPTGDDVRTLQETVKKLEQRVAKLESAQTAKPAARRKPATRAKTTKPAAKPATGNS
jgi:polyhydroxyalkanoate synthesis regulator phasin